MPLPITLNLNLGGNAGHAVQKLISSFSPLLAWLDPVEIEKQKGELKIELKRREIIETKKAELEAGFYGEVGSLVSTQLVIETENRIKNLLKIIEYFSHEAEEKEVNRVEVGLNWAARFIGIAQDCYEEEMQRIWAKILASEIASPGSFSIRTIEFVNTLEKDEADILVKLGTFIFETAEGVFLIPTLNPSIYKEFGVSESEFSLLWELGLAKAKGEGSYFTKLRMAKLRLKLGTYR